MLAALVAAAAFAAVPGTPEPPTPGPLAGASLAWQNDSFGFGGKRQDDHRTNSVAVSVLAGRWALALDYSLLTSLGKPDPVDHVRRGTRADEATATAGWAVIHDRWTSVVIGAGARTRGSLGGEGLQDGWHDATAPAAASMETTYDDTTVAGLAYAYGHRRVGRDNIALHLTGSAAAATDGQLDADAAVVASWHIVPQHEVEEQGQVWVGVRYQARGGSREGASASAVADYEDGLWLEAGLDLGGYVSLSTRRAVDGRGSVGAIAFAWPRR